jgi:hypothetical protein
MPSRPPGVLLTAVWVLLVGAFSLITGPAWAAAGDIRASPHHLVLTKGGPPGQTTITWHTSTPVGEVWASVNGRRRNLIFRSTTTGSHSRQVDWIRPGYTVFSLHSGRTAEPENHVPSGPLLDYTSVTTQPPPASTFGLSYWPPLENAASTLGKRWPVLAPTVAKDLDLIASLGAGVVRVVLWPIGNNFTGDPGAWKISGGPGGDEIRQDVLTRQASNLVKLIKLCRNRGLKVTIAFGNTYLGRAPPSSGRHYEWEWAYPPVDGGWKGFLDDALAWVNGYVTRIESDVDPSVRSTVIAYDFQNEVRPQTFPYLTYLYDHSAIPRGKRAVSVLSVKDNTSALKDALGARHLDYLEFHSYPGGFDPQVQGPYETLVEAFPDSTVLLGEFGQATPGSCSDPSLAEGSQAQTITSKIAQAQSAGIPYFVHWMLWNYSPPYVDQIFGLGYDAHCPKDALGGLLPLTSLLSNPDMESEVRGRPQHWRANGGGPGTTITVTLSARGSMDDPGATNRRYARLSAPGPLGPTWLRSRPVSVKGGDGLWVNAYVRSNMKDVGLGVTQIRTDGTVVKNPGPTFTPTEWGWNNWLRQAGPWRVCLDRQAAKAIVTVRGTADTHDQADPPAPPYYLDVDTVSAATRPRPASCP